MGWLSNITQAFRDDLTTTVSRFKNRPFMEAVVAGCALVAYADGEIKPEEKRKMQRFLEMSPMMKGFDTTDIVREFNRHVEVLDFDKDIGKITLLKVIRQIKDNTEQAETAVRVCCVIGAADNNFDDDEKRVVTEICKELGLDPVKLVH